MELCLRRKKHCRLPKTKKLSFIMEKPKEINQKNFEHIYSFRTLIHYEEPMVLWIKLWFYGLLWNFIVREVK